MKIKLLFFIIFVVGVINVNAQPANDDCAGAQNLGTLPTPGVCTAGIENGAAITVAGTLTGATPANPYQYSTGCSGAITTTSSPANDVWYVYTASGHVAHVNITGTIVNPNIAVYAGNSCLDIGNIGGVGGCTVGNAGGTASLTINQMTIGQTYYIQISSNDVLSAGTFNLSVDNDNDCNNCLQSSTLTVNPAPINGSYAPGTVVDFCYTIDSWSQQNTNWLHGVQITFAPGWSGISNQVAPTAICNAGTWAWYNSVTSSPPPNGSGLTFGQGFYFDTPDAGANPGNNFGDAGVDAFGNPTCDPSPATPLVFCFRLTVAAACNPGASLQVVINTTGDGESGGWQDAGCAGDPAYIFNSQVSCCPPTMTSTAETCAGNDGTATATPIGANGPYDYSWSGPAGYTNNSTGIAGASTISGLDAGTYTVTITDASLCAVTATVTVADNSVIPPAPTTAPVSYCLNAVAAVLTATPSAGGTLNWYGTNAVGGVSSASAPTPSTSVVGPTTYYVSQSVGGCEGPRAPLVVTINALPIATASSNSPVCVGASINLSSGGGTSYAWAGPNAYVNATQNPSIANATLAMAGVYTVTVTNANNCVATAQTTVVVNPLPTPSASNTGPYCLGTTISLSSNGGTGYVWAGPNAFANATQNPTIASSTAAMAGIYTVTVTDANSCVATAQTTVVITAPPVAPTTTPVSYCRNLAATPLIATASAGGTLNWYGTNAVGGVASPTAPTPSTSTAGTTTYYVSQSVGGCEGPRAPLVVTINALPIATASNTGPYCANATINLSSSGGTSYSWTGPSSYSNATQNPSIAAATTTMSGAYVVTVTDANNCISTATTNVVVNPLPSPTATNDGPYCENETINLTSSGGTSYVWAGPNAYANATQNPSLPTATLAMAGAYTVTVTDANTCVATATTTVVVNALPVAVIANTGPYCANQNIDLTCNLAGVTYSWTGPSSFASGVQNPIINNSSVAMAGVYSLTVTDANTCQSSYNTSVVVNPLPIVTISSNSPVCENGTINLTSGGGTVYSWSGPGAYSSNVQNPSIAGATLAMAGNYTVTVTDANNCVNANVTTVNITPLPAAPITNPVVYCQNANTIALTATTVGTLNWYGTNALGGVANPLAPIPSSTTVGLTTFYVSQTVSSCEGPRAPLDVTINPLPTASINTIAPGCAPICRDFFLSSPDNLVSYNWNMGNGIFTGNDTVLQHCYTDAGIYSLHVYITDINGCSDTMHFANWVDVYEVPIAEFNFGPDKVSVLEPEINFVDLSLGSGIVVYSWQFGDPLLSTSGQINPTFAYTDVGVYNVTHVVMNDKGCVDTVIHPVTIPQDWAIYVPNAFSPNDDGINDMFHPYGIGLDEKTYSMWIFDRWGNMIFYTKDWNTYWDGKVQGHSNTVQEDTYIWKINVKSFNGKKFYDTGHVHVVR